MGLFCVNFHFRTADDRALSEALRRRGVTRSRVVAGKNGWTALYEEQASEQDDRRIRDLAGGLSQDLHAAGIAFLVHDSDIACYWLYDNGRLLDEYNSNPDYFDQETDGPPRPAGGRPDLLLPFCRPGVGREELEAILGEENVRATIFAEEVIRRLARALGIDRHLALADYRDADGDHEPDDEDDDEDEDGPIGTPLRAGLMERLAGRFGFDPGAAPADPQVAALVRAAAAGNTEDIARLLAEGAALDAEAPAPLHGRQVMPGLAPFLPGGAPQFVMTPLLAAVVNKQRPAAERLLGGGADPNRVHPHFGTAVHAAAGAGDVELLEVLLDHGADGSAPNARGQTPLQLLAFSRTALDRLAQVQATMKAMGVKVPPQMANVALPVEGWDACERLLKARGAR